MLVVISSGVLSCTLHTTLTTLFLNDVLFYYYYYYPKTEATHAYIQLHPNFSHSKPLPPIVEEGLAQLVAHLFLSEEGIYHTSTTKKIEASRCEIGIIDIDRGGGTEVDSIPSDEELRQYFRFCIETDNGMYGEGFRMAARAYASMGIHELLYYVALHHCFPPVG